MSIKNIIVSAFAVAAFSSLAMAQPGQTGRQPGDGDRMGRPGGANMERGRRDRKPRMTGRGMMLRGGERRGMRMMNFSRLNLTDAQKQRIQSIQNSARSSMEANQPQRQEMGNLMRLQREGLLTTEQGTRLNAMQVQMQTQMRTNAERMQTEILAVLTADQRVLLEQGRQGRGANRRMMPGQPRRPGAPNQGTTPPPPNEN